MQYHDHGPLIGQTTVDNATDLPDQQRENFALQSDIMDRFAREEKFREAVRLAARADGTICGGETAIEQLHRHECQHDTTCSGIIAGHNRASRIIQSPKAIIRL